MTINMGMTSLALQSGLLVDGVESIRKCLGVVPLRTDGSRQRTGEGFSRPDEIDDTSEIVSRLPTEIRPRSFVDVDPVDPAEHRPAAAGVRVRIARHIASHDRRRVRAELLQVIASKGRRRAHDVSAEPDRGGFLKGEKMR